MTDMKLDTLDEVLEEVREICVSSQKDFSSLLHRQILINGLKCKRDELEILDLKIISRAIAEFRYAAKIFKPYRSFRKVSIFGSARTPEDDPYYKLAVKFASLLVQEGFMVITGAADGIMKAGNVGAGADKSFGINILLPFEQAANEVILDDPKLITFKYFFTRKLFFLMEAHAVALFPGGFGTHDELFETLTLLQTGKAPLMPLVLMELPGGEYWERWDQFVKEQMLQRGFIVEEDLSLYRIIHTPEEGVEWIKFFYSTYHSMRQVRDKLVLRLEKELSEAHLRQLNESFGSLVKEGKIEKTRALPDEADEPNLKLNPRIVFSYNQTSAGRLNEMVMTINKMGEKQNRL